jgi:myo-inositol-1(or 4)-monophosphatase
VALEVGGVAQIGAVYDPTRKELFTAERGVGAWLNGRPIHVSTAETLLESLLVTGFPYDVHERVQEIVGLFGEFVGRARAVRRLGSAALDLCYVAAGRMDGFWECDLKPWDIAGGALLVSEAGGVVTNFRGGEFTSRGRNVVASNGRIHQAMVDVIAADAAP